MPTSQSTSEDLVGTTPVRRLGPVLREIPVTARAGMRVPARIYADDALWARIITDRSLDQLMNVATLPGVTEAVYAMPDVHEGYGFPVGGVAAMALPDGVISPGGVGYDINCGVRLLASGLAMADVRPHLEPFVHDLSRTIPYGAGRGGAHRFDDRDLDHLMREGVPALVRRGLARAEDLPMIESGGRLEGADPGEVSERAHIRGHDQAGSIGSGNHFVEVQEVETILDPAAAAAFGLHAGQMVLLIHTGSRGLGHQVCTDHVRRVDQVMVRRGITLPDRQLACAPFNSPEGRAYHGAMCAAANFAFANRQVITHLARAVVTRHFGDLGDLQVVYDVGHNTAKVERYGTHDYCVHRKGATRAFGPSHPDLPAPYRGVGQPVFIPGSMGTASYVMAGCDASHALSFGSACHGAGRAMSRGDAKRLRPGHEVRRELAERGIVVRCPSNTELAEEAPHAYKEVEAVVGVVALAGLARPVARLRPWGVVKG